MLNEMRLGKMSDQTIDSFKKLSRALPPSAIEPTELFPTRNEVENSNWKKMRILAGESRIFNAEDSGTAKGEQLAKLCTNFMAPIKLELKKGSQVMLIKNMDEQLVNGSLGKVIGFMNEKTFAYLEENPEVPANGFLENEGGKGEYEDTKEKIRFMGRQDSGSGASLGAKNALTLTNTAKVWPLVRFMTSDGTERDLLCQPEEWKIELPNGEVQAQRKQIPLILAWALSIHKAQGQTLERVKVDLGKVFEKGQAYVALSRATTKDGLQILNFRPEKVRTHHKVAQFYEALYSVNQALGQLRSSGAGLGIGQKVAAQGMARKVEKVKAVPVKREMSRSASRVGEWDDEEEEAMKMHAWA
jgi:ATP-dependent DNA helicase PIF1